MLIEDNLKNINRGVDLDKYMDKFMENKKYYTPSIKEFHIGFEYEWLKENGEWKKESSPKEITIKDFEKQKYGLRIKYLDKQDIEELGWKFSKTNKIKNWYLGSEEWFNRTIPSNPSGRYWSLCLHHDPELKTIKITANTNYGEIDEVFFEGLIKNKSELKRLMNQIGVI